MIQHRVSPPFQNGGSSPQPNKIAEGKERRAQHATKKALPAILIIESDRFVAELMRTTLTPIGRPVWIVGDGDAAVDYCRSRSVGAILLDIHVNERDSVIERCRHNGSSPPPFIVLTPIAHAEQLLDNPLLYEADDYVSKPFSPKDLVMRVTRLLLRPRPAATARKQNIRDSCFEGFRLDRGRRQVVIGNDRVRLTPNECQLLDVLVRHSGEVVEKNELVEAVWMNRFYNDENVLRVTMRRLRNKIERDPSRPQFLVTVYGKGYKFTPGPSEPPAARNA